MMLVFGSICFDKVKVEIKECRIPEVLFYAKLNSAGSAMVNEYWTVEFQKGTFTRFYKDIYKEVSNVEKYRGVSNLFVSIDDELCTETEETNQWPAMY